MKILTKVLQSIEIATNEEFDLIDVVPETDNQHPPGKKNGDNHIIEPLSASNSERIINYKQIHNFSVSTAKHNEKQLKKESNFAEVMFKCKRNRIYRNDNNLELHNSEYVIVEVECGVDIATIVCSGVDAQEKLKTNYKNESPNLTIVRHVSEEDMQIHLQNLEDEAVVTEKAKELVKLYELEMKVTESEWQFDRQRLTVYFTAPQRIDFRELVKELARIYRTRIELRQISTREEARRIGGMGPCGRKLCCASLNNECCRVTLDHARTQQLANNVAKLSGYCGRLKCCLLFEYDNYIEAFKKYPPLDSIVELPEGNCKILKVDIFKDIVFLQVFSSPIYKTITFLELQDLISQGKVKLGNNNHHNNNKKAINYDFDGEIDLSLLEDPIF